MEAGQGAYVVVGDMTMAREYAGAFQRAGLTSLDAFLRHSASQSLGKPGLPSWRERVRVELDGTGGGERVVYVKRFRRPPIGAQWGRVVQGVVRHGTAWIEWHWMRRLAADGIATATPVAFGERMRGAREEASVLVSAAVPGVSLESWVRDRTSRCPRVLVTQLAEFVGRFHGRGYVHRDLYLSHVFFDERSGELRLIDLQRVMRPRWRRVRWQIKDLAALDYSTPRSAATSTDRVRFLRRYLGLRRLGESGRRLVRRVRAKSMNIARHDQRRRARLFVERVN
ncbi:MAG: hypothetical protein HOP29_13565 [Phycisphaerales bacterium]|nr:hypothetical protein [Phycisphaerales bacterium]